MSDLKAPANPALANIKRNRSPSVSNFLGQVTAGGVNSPQLPRRPSNAGAESGSTGSRAQSDDKDVNEFLNNIG